MGSQGLAPLIPLRQNKYEILMCGRNNSAAHNFCDIFGRNKIYL